MACSLPDSSVHRISQARKLEWVAMSPLQGIFPTQGLNLCLLRWRVDSLLLSHQGSPTNFEPCPRHDHIIFAASNPAPHL